MKRGTFMKYIVVSQITLAVLFAHGKEAEHMHFFSSLHLEYFAVFAASLAAAFFIYSRFLKGNR